MPLIFNKYQHNTHIAIWQITESLDELLKQISLEKQDLEKLNSFSLDRRKKEWLAARILIKKAINITPIINYLESGKPVLTNSPFKVSISHTKEFVAISLSSKFEPGIDIEYPSERVNKITSRFIASEERSYIAERDSTNYHMLIWCTKEAIFKIINKKNVTFNRQLIVQPFTIKKQGTIIGNYIGDNEQIRLNFAYQITNEFFLVYRIDETSAVQAGC